MNKTSIAKGMVDYLESIGSRPMTMGDAERAYAAFVEVLHDNLIRHGKIRIPRVGTFLLTTRKGHKIKNFNQEEVVLSDHPVIKFKSVEGLPHKLMNVRVANEEDLDKPPDLDLDLR